MKKLLPIIIIGILVLCGLGAVATTNDKKVVVSLADELDQYQTECTGMEGIGYDEGIQLSLAQSFTPQKNTLTRVFIYASRHIYPNSFHLAIRSELNGGDLTAVSVSYTAFPLDNPKWVEFNFEDISVTIGETYYMIMSTPKKIGHFYFVGLSHYNPYPHGIAYYKINEQSWVACGDIDLCFKTYGKGGPPNKPDINGPTNGKAGNSYTYTFTSTDPDGDDVSYYVRWGDGDITDWTTYQASGPPGYDQSHTWAEMDTYTIEAKAKDIHGLESDWSYLDVTIPKNKMMLHNPMVLRLLERFPILQKIFIFLTI